MIGEVGTTKGIASTNGWLNISHTSAEGIGMNAGRIAHEAHVWYLWSAHKDTEACDDVAVTEIVEADRILLDIEPLLLMTTNPFLFSGQPGLLFTYTFSDTDRFSGRN